MSRWGSESEAHKYTSFVFTAGTANSLHAYVGEDFENKMYSVGPGKKKILALR